MRKYYRLILLISSGFLFLLFLYYQLKYEQLRDVIQGMNVFGHRLADRDCRERIHSSLSARLRHWPPVWTQVGDQVSIYSVFGSPAHVHALALLRRANIADSLRCQFWYPNHSVLRGQLSYHPFSSSTSDVVPSLLSCSAIAKNTSKLEPIGVSFHDNTREHQTMHLIIPAQSSHRPSSIQIGVCVEPLPPGFHDVFRLGELLAHYLVAGARYLVFYDQGVSKPVREIFSYTATLNDSIHLLPWNVPFTLPSSSNLAFLDCYMRMTHEFNVTHVLRIKTSHFLKPTGNNLTQMMAYLPPGLQDTVLRPSPVTFCLNMVGDIISKGLHLPYVTVNKIKQTMKDKKVFPMVYPTHMELVKVFEMTKKSVNSSASVLPKTVGAVYQYVFCTMREKSLVKKNEEMRNLGLKFVKTPLIHYIEKSISQDSFLNVILP